MTTRGKLVMSLVMAVTMVVLLAPPATAVDVTGWTDVMEINGQPVDCGTSRSSACVATLGDDIIVRGVWSAWQRAFNLHFLNFERDQAGEYESCQGESPGDDVIIGGPTAHTYGDVTDPPAIGQIPVSAEPTSNDTGPALVCLIEPGYGWATAQAYFDIVPEQEEGVANTGPGDDLQFEYEETSIDLEASRLEPGATYDVHYVGTDAFSYRVLEGIRSDGQGAFKRQVSVSNTGPSGMLGAPASTSVGATASGSSSAYLHLFNVDGKCVALTELFVVAATTAGPDWTVEEVLPAQGLSDGVPVRTGIHRGPKKGWGRSHVEAGRGEWGPGTATYEKTRDTLVNPDEVVSLARRKEGIHQERLARCRAGRRKQGFARDDKGTCNRRTTLMT